MRLDPRSGLADYLATISYKLLLCAVGNQMTCSEILDMDDFGMRPQTSNEGLEIVVGEDVLPHQEQCFYHRVVFGYEFDDARPGNNKPVNGKNLRAAVDSVLAGEPVTESQLPATGCNIKWKPGNAPDYFG